MTGRNRTYFIPWFLLGIFLHFQNLIFGNDDPVCKTGKKTQMCIMDLDSEGEGEGGMIWENGNSNMYTVM